MRLSCPDCAAEYDVPDAALGTRRRLRCSDCGSSWEWSPPAAEPLCPPAAAAAPEAAPMIGADKASEVPPPPPQPPRQPPTPTETIALPGATPRIEVPPERRMPPAAPPPPEPTGHAMLAWAASLAIIVLALVALYVWRAPIMHAWPSAIRLYAALGLA